MTRFRRPGRRLAASLFLATILSGPLAGMAAAAVLPSPEVAPHGIANDAAEPEPSPVPGPAELGPVAVPEPTAKALRYARTGNAWWVFNQIWGLLVPGVILFSSFSAKIRNGARRIVHGLWDLIVPSGIFPSGRAGRIWHAVTRALRDWYLVIVAYFFLFLLLTFVVDLPVSYFAGFARQHAYDLSNQSFGKWFGDQIKALGVGVVMGALFLWIPYLLFKKSPKRWWLWTSVAAVPVLAFVMLVEPVFIAPLFNNFGPMKDKALEKQILALASRAGIEGARVFEVDKSKDTNMVNAYVTGFGGTKRIVLWDTTLKKLDPKEILFVMGHEMGHYVLGHVVKSIFFAAILLLVTLYAVYKVQARLVARFKDRFGFDDIADIASLPLVLLLIGVFSFVITPVATGYSRWQEHEADRFGLEITRDNHDAATAFVKLQQENLSLPRRGLLYKLWRADHPLLGDRIDFCNSYHPWTEGKAGRYDRLFKH